MLIMRATVHGAGATATDDWIFEEAEQACWQTPNPIAQDNIAFWHRRVL
jgi:hypothetical protein